MIVSTIARPKIGLDTLQSRIDGQIVASDSPAYDEARKTHDIMNHARPLAIVQAAGTEDVAAAVSFARDNALPLAVRSGGHSPARHSMVDDALVIDLSGMKRVNVDPESGIARVQPGATSGDLVGPAHEHGRALSTGDTASVGMGGLTTGGGIGFMVRKHGLAIDNLLSAQVVTATGEIVTASQFEHPDLFWAIRGGGGNFGVITEFTFRLAPVSHIFGGELILPATREVIRGYLDYVASAPDDLTTLADIVFAPPAPFIPTEHEGELALWIYVVWTGDPEDGERTLTPLRALAEPIADTVRVMPYPDMYLSTEAMTYPFGSEIRTMFADNLSDATLDTFLDAMGRSTSPYSLVHLRGLGGAMSRVAPEATAFAHRDARYLVAVIGVWVDENEDADPHRAWAQSTWEAIRHEGRGAYVNFIAAEGRERIHDAYPPATLSRLRAIKHAYDPDNLFRFNQNIVPAPPIAAAMSGA